MRTVRLNLSSTILWKRDSSVGDLGKQGAHFKAEIAVEMEHFFLVPAFFVCVSVYKPHMFTEKSLIPALRISSVGQAFNAVGSEAFPSSHLSTLADISNPHVTFV